MVENLEVITINLGLRSVTLVPLIVISVDEVKTVTIQRYTNKLTGKTLTARFQATQQGAGAIVIA